MGINKEDISKVIKFSNQDRTRSNGFKLTKFSFQREIGRHWYGNRVVEIVSANIVDHFKMDEKGWVETGAASHGPTGLLQFPYFLCSYVRHTCIGQQSQGRCGGDAHNYMTSENM